MKPAFVTALAACGLVLGAVAFTASCAQSATNVAVRTFERAQRIDVVCMRVQAFDPTTNQLVSIKAEPQPQARCAPVPVGVDGTLLEYHLYAMVTQSARGEVAVVDLTAGYVIDGDHSTPGINFIPVGAIPTDVAVAPDGQVAYVAAAEVNKPAIYAIASRNILGDSQVYSQSSRGLPVADAPPPPTLPSLPVCALDQAPGAMVVVPHVDTSDAGAAPTYELAVVLPGDGAGRKARLVTIDPAPFIRGAGLDASAGTTYPPGALAKCVLTSDITLEDTLPAPPASVVPWNDGIKYPGTAPEAPPFPLLCPGGPDAGPPAPVDGGTTDGGATDGGASEAGSDAGAPVDAGSPDSGSDAGSNDAGDGGPLDFGPGLRPHGTSIARDGTTVYIGDDGLPLIHVLDLSKAGSPKELPPLVATSLLDTVRKVEVGDIAVSPTTSDYKKFLYAVDKKDGSIMVFDVADLPTAPRGPLVRPHAELNPFQAPDRILFNAPVAAVSFVRHDFPLTHVCDTPVSNARGGLLCNPNPNAGPNVGEPASDQGAGMCYRANIASSDVPALAPTRLRGIFAFATLSNGNMVALDVDDWDAPCRRPDPMNASNIPNAITPPEPAVSGPNDLDPYHVPSAFQGTAGETSAKVSQESFFPVSAPNRPRSLYFLRSDSVTGVHAPQLNGIPQLFSQNSAVPTVGGPGLVNPVMLATSTNLADPSLASTALTPLDPDPTKRNPASISTLPNDAANHTPSVRFSWEDPQVHLDQDWTVTYEGTLPSFDGKVLATDITTIDGYKTLLLPNTSALFCRKGIEDYRIGTARAAALASEMTKFSIPVPTALASTLTDYVQFSDEILDPGDPYWAEANNECWSGDLAAASPQVRHDACTSQFGAAADQSPQRDFPILEAYDDRLVLGRYAYTDAGILASQRSVVASDPSNGAALARARCCFHHQARFKVRTGATWLTIGSQVGLLHRVTTDSSGACVLSCDPREALLSSRAPAVPWPTGTITAPGRNSLLAMRNPAFSFVVWNGQTTATVNNQQVKVDAPPVRDLQWKFSTRGQFSPLVINTASSTTAVSPQSMRFIDSLGQLALVDGASQGLILIDLNTVTLAHTPFF
jgi:hypothetical protein